MIEVVLPIENLTGWALAHPVATGAAGNFDALFPWLFNWRGVVERLGRVRASFNPQLVVESGFDLTHSSRHVFERQLEQLNTNEKLVGDRFLTHDFWP